MPLEKPLQAEPGWTELHAPDLIQFEKPGETVSGILVTVGAVELKGKRVTQYVLARDEKRLKLLATFDLMQKLTAAHRGCQVRIKYLGQDENIRGGPERTPMKVFSVQIKGTPTSQSQIPGGPITDEDIPF